MVSWGEFSVPGLGPGGGIAAAEDLREGLGIGLGGWKDGGRDLWMVATPKETGDVLRVHSDAADLGWRGTLSEDLRPRVSRNLCRGIWSPEEHDETSSFRELCALPLVVQHRPPVSAKP